MDDHLCVECGKNKRASNGPGKTPKRICGSCRKRKYYPGEAQRLRLKNRPHLKHRGDKCEACGFVPVHVCQLDVDHKDGNKKNGAPSNLQTLCANCHRLKTYQNQDWKP